MSVEMFYPITFLYLIHYILTEPNENPLTFGLQFRVLSDVEHGRGMKIEADTMNIIDYGLADVAFC